MRTMYDAVTAGNIPRSASMVAGYVDKIRLEPWTSADWDRFPGAVKVQIVKKASTNAGHVLDVEPGDATPAEAPGWVRMRREAGADPTVYMNASTWPSVRMEFQRQDVAQPHYWVAKYDGDPAWGTGWAALGCVAKQYAGDVPPGVDLSSVADYWPGVDPAPITRARMEDDVAQGTKGAGQISIPVNGARQLFCLIGGQGAVVKGHLYWVRDTPGGSGAAYAGDRAVQFDADRPGPVSIPENVRGATLFYDTASANFAVWAV
jgi:hypothetical protein